MGEPPGAGVEMTGTARRAAGWLPRTHPSGRREHAAGGASEDGTEKTLERVQKPARVRTPAFKASQRGVVSPRPAHLQATPRGFSAGLRPGAQSLVKAAGSEPWPRDKRPESRLFLRLPAHRRLLPSPPHPLSFLPCASGTSHRGRCRPTGFPPPSRWIPGMQDPPVQDSLWSEFQLLESAAFLSRKSNIPHLD